MVAGDIFKISPVLSTHIGNGMFSTVIQRLLHVVIQDKAGK